MPIKNFVIAVIASVALTACNFDMGVSGPLIDFIFGHDDSPLTYCETPMTNTPIVTSGFGFNLKNTRNQPSLIDSTTIAGLTLKYTVVDEKEVIRRGAPAATENVLYYTGVDKVYALNRDTGCAYWYYEPQSKFGAIRSASVLLIDNAPLANKRTLIIGTEHAQVIALDATTGHPIWSVAAGNPGWLTVNGFNKTKSMITGGMQYHDGKIYVPFASKEVADAVVQATCCKTHGALKALDSTNGNIVWEYQTTAEATMQNWDPTKYGPSGVAIWSTPMIDVARSQILVGTGQNFSKPLTDNSNAVVALDMNTGQEKWIFKGTAEDFYNASCAVNNPPFQNCPAPTYDYDMITPALAFDAATNKDVVIAADKSGKVYSLDPDNGDLHWQRKIGAGGLLGGVHWAVAIDADTVYAGVADLELPKTTISGSTIADLISITPKQVPNATPGVYALRLSDGTIRWQAHPKHFHNGAEYDSIFSAGLSVTNDVLFAGSLDGTITAFNTATAAVLWSDYTAIDTTDVMGRKGNGGAIDSVGPVIAGKQLILNSGYSLFNIGARNQWQGGPGNTIFVYELP